jgi:hypothetical protein
MAEEKVKDEIVDEEAQLKAQLDAIKRAEQPEPPAEAAAAEPIPPAEEPEKPAVEVKPAVEAKPKETPTDEESRPPAGKAWQKLRAEEKRILERQAALDAKERELAQREGREPNKEPDFESQPADYLKARQDRLDQEFAQERQQLAQERQERQYREYVDTIKTEEGAFVKDHPDYYQAADFLVQKETQRWQRVGLEVVHTQNVLNNARSNDPRFAQLRNQIGTLSNNPQILAEAEKQGRDPEEMAAWVIARDTHITSRRDELATAARARGKSVAEAAYDEAVDWGWNGNPQDGKPKAQEDAARARVQQAKDVAAASRSLSDSESAESAPEVRVLKSRDQVLQLDEESLDALIKSGNYRQL